MSSFSISDAARHIFVSITRLSVDVGMNSPFKSVEFIMTTGVCMPETDVVVCALVNQYMKNPLLQTIDDM